MGLGGKILGSHILQGLSYFFFSSPFSLLLGFFPPLSSKSFDTAFLLFLHVDP